VAAVLEQTSRSNVPTFVHAKVSIKKKSVKNFVIYTLMILTDKELNQQP
jgi:hypothetical protein